MALLYTWLNKPNNYHLSSGWLFIKYVILLLLAINVMICLLLIPIVLAYINDHSNHDDFGGASVFAASVYAVIFLIFAIGTHTLGFISVKREVYQLMFSYCLAASLILLSIILSVETRERPLISWLCLNFTTILLTLGLSLVTRRMDHPAGPSIVNQTDLDDVLYTR
uniref:Uncharacterized protein n=1 Tax=Tetranychus urticae TaxID=32264 RepID=T1L2K2_TETUR